MHVNDADAAEYRPVDFRKAKKIACPKNLKSSVLPSQNLQNLLHCANGFESFLPVPQTPIFTFAAFSHRCGVRCGCNL